MPRKSATKVAAVPTPDPKVQALAKAVADELGGILNRVIQIPPRGPSSEEQLWSLLGKLRKIAAGGPYELE